MTLPRQSKLISMRNARVAEEARAAEEARKKADPRYIKLAELQRREQEKYAQIDAGIERYKVAVAAYLERKNKYYSIINDRSLNKWERNQAVADAGFSGKNISGQLSRQGTRLGKTYKSLTRKRDDVRRSFYEDKRTVQRAINKDISISDQRSSEREKDARQRNKYKVKEQNKVLEDRFGKEVVAAMSPEAKATAYEQATNKNFVATPNTAKAKDTYNYRQEANTQAKKLIETSGATNAREFFEASGYRPETTVTASVTTPMYAGVTVRQGGTGINDKYLAPNQRVNQPNTSTPSGAVYSSPINEPNTSTPSGAVYTSPPATTQKIGFFDAVKEAPKLINRGYWLKDGIKVGDFKAEKGTPAYAREGLYRTGEFLNVVPIGVGFKLVQGANTLIKTAKATKIYKNSPFLVKAAANTAAFVGGSRAAGYLAGKQTELYETKQLTSNLEGFNITPEEFRGVVSSSLEKSRKSGGLNAFGNQLTTRLGTNNDAFESNVYGQLREKGLTEPQALSLLPVAQTTRQQREVIEAGYVIAQAGLTELYGRGGFATSNVLVTNTATNKVFRTIGEGTFKAGANFAKSPKVQNFFKPLMTKDFTKYASRTTKGTVLTVGGITEGTNQEYLTQQTRQLGGEYPSTTYKVGGKYITTKGTTNEQIKAGYLGGTFAGFLGTKIAEGFETGSTRVAKNWNLLANTLDPFEKPGDMLADFTTGVSKLEYRVPTITTTGTGKNPTFTLGTESSQAQANKEYFTGTNKGQDTTPKNDGLRFNTNTQTKNVDKPAVIKKDNPTTPTFNFAPKPQPQPQTIPIPLPEDNPVPIPNDNKAPNTNKNVVPLPEPNPIINPVPIPIPIPAPVTNPVPIPITIPIPVVTPTPPEAAAFAVGGGFAFGSGQGRGKKRRLGYTPSAFSLITGFKGERSSKGAVKTGFAIRPIAPPKTSKQRVKKKGKKKNSDEELLSLLGRTKKNGRKRKYKRFTSF